MRSLPSRLLATTCALSLSIISTSCARNDTAAVRNASIQQAIAEAEATRPRAELPARCRTAVPHAPVELGMSAIEVLKLEQQQLNVANTVILDCSKFNLARQ